VKKNQRPFLSWKSALTPLQYSWCALALGVALAATARAETITIQPTTEAASKETKISNTSPATNFSTDLNLSSVVDPINGDAISQGLLQFDLAATFQAVPVGKIKSAKITLYSTGLGANGGSGGPAVGGDVALRTITSPWKEEAGDPGTDPLATYNNVVTTPVITVGDTVATTTVAAAGFYEWTVTDLVKSWASGTVVNNGVLISLVPAGADVGLADGDTVVPDVSDTAPKITIEADTAGPRVNALASVILSANAAGNASLPDLTLNRDIGDDFDATEAIQVVQAPASGSTLPLGDTVVTVTATDTVGNVTVRETTVTVTRGQIIAIQPTTEAASKETKIYQHTPTMNFSSNIDVTSADTGALFNSLLQFDLASTFQTVTPAKIKSVKITLFCRELGAAGGDVTLRAITSPWKENAADAGDAPLATYNNVIVTPLISIGDVAANAMVTSAGFFDWDVTELAKSWSAGTAVNHGVYISLATNGGDVRLADCDLVAPNVTGTAPKITIVADTAGPSINALASVTLTANGAGQAVVPDLTVNRNITDNFDAANVIQVAQSPVAGSNLGLGSHQVTVTATDSVGNVTTRETTVIVTRGTIVAIQPTVETASKETKIYEHSPTMNFSSNLSVTGPNIGSLFQSLLQFDLASTFQTYPTAKIKSAKITLFSQSLGASGGPAAGGDITMRTILGPWKETAADAGTAPLATHNNVVVNSLIPIGDVAATSTVTSAGFFDWDVTALVQSWSAGTVANNGVFLSLITNDADVGLSDCDLVTPNVTGTAPKITLVIDTTAPHINVLTSVTLAADANGEATVPDLTVSRAPTDDFDAANAIQITQSPTAGTTLEVGTHVVTVTATDTAGNTFARDTTVIVTGGQVVAIQPTTEAASKDAKIYQHSPAGNLTSNLSVTSADIGSLFQSLLQFDLDSTFQTLTTAQIKSAKITLYSLGVGTSGGPPVGGDVTLRTILTPWKETTGDPGTGPLASYNNVVVTPSIFVGGVAASTNVTTNGFYDWDVTNLVKMWSAGTAFHNGVLISLATGGGDVGLADCDTVVAGVAGASPKITIVADVTAPQIAPLASVSLAANDAGQAVLPNLNASRSITDNFDVTGSIQLSQSPAAGTTLGLGTYTVTVTATDTAGNVSTSDTTVIVSFSGRVTDAEVGGESSGTGTSAASLTLPAGYTLPTGTVIAGYAAPVLSDFRDLAAKVTLAQGKKKTIGIYYQALDGTESLVAVQGSAAFNGSTFKSFLDPVISSDGSIAFAAKVTGGGLSTAEDDGVWTDAFGNGLELVLLEGSPIEGLIAGSFTQPILKTVQSISLRDGELLALVTLASGKAGVTSATDTALIRLTAAGEGSIVLREGSPITLPPAAASPIKTLSVLFPALGSNGHGRWHGAEAVVAKVGLKSGATAFLKVDQANAASTLLATGSDSDITNAKWKTFALPAVGGSGEKFAVLGTLQALSGTVAAANDLAIAYSDDGAAFTTLAREGFAAPLPVAPPSGAPTFATFFDPVVNDAGKIAFQATIKGSGVTGANKTGLWAGTSTGVQLLARTGSPATGTDGAVVTNGPAWKSFLSYALPDGADSGVIFVATLQGGGSTAKDNLGLWAVDSAGLLRLLVRTGAAGLHPDPTKAVLKVTGLTLLTATPGSYGVAHGYNAFGSIAVTATFEDKSQAILRVDVP